MKKFIAICFALILLCTLVACDPPLTKGYVLERHDIPAHTNVHWHHVNHCIKVRKVRTCTTTSYSTLDHIPEKWVVTLSSCNPDTRNRDECQNGSEYVSRATYSELRVGEYVDLTNSSV